MNNLMIPNSQPTSLNEDPNISIDLLEWESESPESNPVLEGRNFKGDES